MTAVIFDIDDTLANTVKVDDKCFIKAFKNVFNIDISNQNWSQLTNITDWGISEEIIFKNWNRVPTKVEYEKVISEFVSLLKSELKLNKKQFQEVDGALDFINFLKTKPNISVGIATGGWQKPANLKLKTIEIDSSTYAFGNSDHYKTREEILLKVITELKCTWKTEFGRVIYLGDGIWDYTTCKKLGIEFIGIECSKNNKLREIGVKTIFNNFKQPELIYKHIMKTIV